MKIVVFLAAIAAALMLASTAFASALTCAHGNGCGAGTLGNGTSPASEETLPFTGLDLAGIAGVGVVLLGGGVLLHRASRRPSR
jgi:hypothetical protein